MTQAPDTLMDDLLVRVDEICRDTTYIASGSKNLFEHPGRGPFPRTICWLGTDTLDFRQGSDYIDLSLIVMVRLLGGSVNSGGQGEHEAETNKAIYALINRFGRTIGLESPETKEPFRYLNPNLPARFVRVGGLTGMAYGNPANPDRYFGVDFQLETHLRTPRR